MSYKIRFEFEEDPTRKVEVDAEEGERLTAVAHRGHVVIQQTCGGTPSCADCKVKVVEGVDTGFAPAEGAELRLTGNVYFITRERLSCQALVKGDATVRVPKTRARNEKVFVPRRRDTDDARRSREKTHGQEKEVQKIPGKKNR